MKTLKIDSLKLYKNKITEILNNEFVYAKDYEVDPSLDPLLVPVYVDPNGKLTLEKQTELRAAKGARVYLYSKENGMKSLATSMLKEVEFESLIFPNLESTSNTTEADGPFYYNLYECPQIKKIYFPELKSIPQYGMKGFLYNCPNLTLVEFPKLESIGTWGFVWSFDNCPKLKDIYFPSLITVGYSVFQYCGRVAKYHFKKSLANDPNFSPNRLDIPAKNIVFDI